MLEHGLPLKLRDEVAPSPLTRRDVARRRGRGRWLRWVQAGALVAVLATAMVCVLAGALMARPDRPRAGEREVLARVVAVQTNTTGADVTYSPVATFRTPPGARARSVPPSGSWIGQPSPERPAIGDPVRLAVRPAHPERARALADGRRLPGALLALFGAGVAVTAERVVARRRR